MSILREHPISRRSAITGIFASWALLPRVGAASQISGKPPKVDLGQGLEIRDYRLFPAKDVMHFIVEIYNTTDAALDTPTIGVELEHLAGENFGWANPFAKVIYPHSSQGLLGVAPPALGSDFNWGAPKWMICNPIQTVAAKSLQDWKVEISCDSQILDFDDLVTQVTLTNKGKSTIGPFSVQGLIWDQDSRLCGGSMNITLTRLVANESRELWIHIKPGLNYAADPFAIIESVEQLEPQYSLQPANPINQGCPVIMP